MAARWLTAGSVDNPVDNPWGEMPGPLVTQRGVDSAGARIGVDEPLNNAALRHTA